jgi:hypothetical protein
MQDSSGTDFQYDEHVDRALRQQGNRSRAPIGRGSGRRVLHACVPDLVHGGRAGMYRRTVRADTRILSLTRSSAAIRSSPHVAAVIVAMSCRRSVGIGGRPGARDFNRQHKHRNNCGPPPSNLPGSLCRPPDYADVVP